MRLKCRRMGVVCSRLYVSLSVALLLAAGAIALGLGSRLPKAPTTQGSKFAHSLAQITGTSDLSQQALASFGRLPMAFEANQGQTDGTVKYLARGRGYNLFLTQREAVLTLPHSAGTASVLRMDLVGANLQAEPVGTEALPGKSNYLIGNDSAKWQRDIPQFARVRYQDVYPGVDLVYYGDQGSLEYDFEVAPGSDPSKIEMSLQGTKPLALDAHGNLLLPLAGTDARLEAPRVYQKFGRELRAVKGRFALRGTNVVGFEVGPYDATRALVIDPVLQYSTYLGGSGDEACSVILGTGTPVSGCPAVAVDSALSAYVAGSTTSPDFPDVSCSTSFQCALKGTANIFIAKFNSNGSALIYTTYLGGNLVDYPAGIGVDGGFNVIVAGTTTSTNFPTNGTNAAFQTTPVSTNKHAFVSKLDPSGHTLLYSTYLSGNGADIATGVALDTQGNAYVTGTTASTEVTTGFPSTSGAFQTSAASGSKIQFFLTKINTNVSGVSSVPYSTYFGGGNTARPASSGPAAVGGGVAVDNSNNVYITGGTSFLRVGQSNDFPILNAFQGCLDAAPSTTSCPSSVTAYDAFVAKLNPAAVTGTQLLYSTYIGGTEDDIGYGIAVDSSSSYVTGSTTSIDFPTAGTGVFQSSNGGGMDGFLAKLGNPTTSVATVPLNYFTYIGGTGTDVGLAVAVDNIQGAHITGWTDDLNSHFPLLNPVQNSFGGGASDAFVAIINTSATSPTASGNSATFLGGNAADYGTGIAVDFQNATYVAGETQSGTFPVVVPAVQSNLDGLSDAFVTKYGPTVSLQLVVTASPTPVGVGNQVSFVYTVTNSGDSVSNVTFVDNLPNTGAATFVSATTSATGNGCGPASGGTVLCNLGTMMSGATATVTVILTPVAPTTPASSSVLLGNSGFVGISGSSLSSANSSVVVNDYKLTVSPSSNTVAAGVPASYTATVTPTGNIPSSVSISCTSPLPTGATCTETTNPIPNLDNGPASTVLIINTTARVTTTTQLWQKGRPFYAVWLPISGLAFVGVGLGRRRALRRKIFFTALLAGFLTLILFQPACSSSKTVTTTTGTPAGTYVVTVGATSGSNATRTATVTLIVQ